MPRHQGIQRVEWDFCDRCGFEYPVTQLVMQNGKKVCTKYCFDKALIGEREMEIAVILDDESELQDDERFVHDTDDLRFIT
jgi:hypothetical protein